MRSISHSRPILYDSEPQMETKGMPSSNATAAYLSGKLVIVMRLLQEKGSLENQQTKIPGLVTLGHAEKDGRHGVCQWRPSLKASLSGFNRDY